MADCKPATSGLHSNFAFMNFAAVFVECRGQPLGDLTPHRGSRCRRRSSMNTQLAVPQEPNRRRRRRIRREVPTRAVGGFDIAAGKHGRDQIGPPCRAAAPGRCQAALCRPRIRRRNSPRSSPCQSLCTACVDSLRGPQLRDTEARQFGTHRRDEGFGIRHDRIVLDY